jgi:hypothetical protein
MLYFFSELIYKKKFIEVRIFKMLYFFSELIYKKKFIEVRIFIYFNNKELFLEISKKKIKKNCLTF